MKKNKTSLLKDCFSAEAFSEKSNKDEMIIFERNKISYVGMTSLMGILLVFGILAERFSLKEISQYISAVIGIVNYGMLIAFCFKGIVKHSAATTAFIWSIITLPMSIVNLFLDMFVREKLYSIVSPVSIIVIAVLLYVVSDFIYKRASRED